MKHPYRIGTDVFAVSVFLAGNESENPVDSNHEANKIRERQCLIMVSKEGQYEHNYTCNDNRK